MDFSGFDRPLPGSQRTKTGGYNPPVATKKKGRGGTATSLISELGGTGGALGGAAAGAAIGSVVPVLGTAIGGLLGAGIGGFLGGTGGRVVENKVRDDRIGLGDALTEGALSGVMSIGPGNVLKAGKLGLSKVTGKGTSSLAEALTKTAPTPSGKPLASLVDTSRAEVGAATREGRLANPLEKTEIRFNDPSQITAPPSSKPLRSSMSGRADEWGIGQIGKQIGPLGDPEIRKFNPSDTISSLSNMGLEKKQDWERTAHAVTGSDGMLNQAVSKAVGGAHAVDIGHLPGTVEKAIHKSGLVDTHAKGLTNEIVADLDLIDPADPQSVMTVLRNLEARSNEYLGRGGTFHRATSMDKKRAKAIGEVRRDLEDTLYNKAEANGNVSAILTPEFRQGLIDLHPNNSKWAAHVDNNIMTATSVKQLRGAQAPFVNISGMLDHSKDKAFSTGSRMVNAAENGQMPTFQGAVISGATKLVKEPLTRASGQAARKVAPLLPGGTGLPAGAPLSLSQALTAPSAKKMLRNQTIGNAGEAMLTPAPTDAQGLAANQQIDPVTGQPVAADQSVQGTQDALPPIANQQGGQMYADGSTGMPQDTANDPFNPANVATNIQTLLANGGNMDTVKEYLSMVSTIQDLTATKTDKMSAAMGTSLASSANGENTLNQLEGLFQQSGGGSGKLGGGLANALSKVGMNDNAQVYNDLAASSVSQLAKALNGGGQVSDTDAAVVIQALPRVTDSPQVARAKFAALKARLSAAQQNTLQFSGGNSQADLLSTLNQ